MLDFIIENREVIIFFFIAQFLNVLIATIKNVLVINGTKVNAAIFNSISYGIYAIVVKSISTLPLELTISISIVTNFSAVYLGLLILEKVRKDKLWKITAIVPADNLESFKQELTNKEANFVVYTTTWKEFKVVDIFSESKKESDTISAIFKKFKVKYIVNANDGFLQ
jgi:hypothetical protein